MKVGGESILELVLINSEPLSLDTFAILKYSPRFVGTTSTSTTEYSQTMTSNTNGEPLEAPPAKPKVPDPPPKPTNAPPVNEHEFVTASDDLGKIELDKHQPIGDSRERVRPGIVCISYG